MMASPQQLCLLTFGQITQYWNQIEWRLHQIPGFDRDWTLEALLEKLAEGTLSVWTVGSDMIVLTTIVEYPKTRVMQIIFAQGSELDEHLASIWDVFHHYADLKDCSRIELFGRPGWFRKLRKFPDVRTEFTVLSTPVRKRSKH